MCPCVQDHQPKSHGSSLGYSWTAAMEWMWLLSHWSPGLSPSLLVVGEGSILNRHFPRAWIGRFLKPTKGCSYPRPTGASQSFPYPAMLAILPLYTWSEGHMGCTHGAGDPKRSWNLVLHRQDTQDAPSQSPDPSSKYPEVS